MKVSKNKKFQQKKCTKCGTILNAENCNAYDIERSKYICLMCLQEKNQNLYMLNRDNIRKRQQKYEQKNKIKIIQKYGEKCVCCGESRYEFLTIDHIKNNGAEERKTTKQGTGGKLYRWLIKNNFPNDNYQLLCFNCNCSKGFYGYCPHHN